jgi:hypothetical protein
MLVATIVAAAGCGPAPEPIAEDVLVGKIVAIGELTRDAPDEVVHGRLTRFAEDMTRRRIRVESAVVSKPYVRSSSEEPFFGVDYDPQNFVFLADVAPDRSRRLRRHRHWVSAVRTFEDRVLSFEVAVSRRVYERLERGQTISFEGSVAGVIRGRNVVCIADAVEVGPARG